MFLSKTWKISILLLTAKKGLKSRLHLIAPTSQTWERSTWKDRFSMLMWTRKFPKPRLIGRKKRQFLSKSWKRLSREHDPHLVLDCCIFFGDHRYAGRVWFFYTFSAHCPVLL